MVDPASKQSVECARRTEPNGRNGRNRRGAIVAALLGFAAPAWGQTVSFTEVSGDPAMGLQTYHRAPSY
ncbi:MAG: hypothetical protein H6736_24350, partial [Alphaproteobacteria bacterium]|nr:hypothetical protein [Alphaproteobacteria bacterium]